VKAARAAVVVLLALVALGAYAFTQQYIQGDAVTDLRTIGAGGAVWGLYVVGDGFFASAALAILAVACVVRAGRLRELEGVARIALPLGVAGLLASLGCVLADLGRPLVATVNLPLVGRPRSPFFWTFTLVAGASLVASLVHLVLASRPGWAARAQESRWPRFWRFLACGWQGTASAQRRRERVDFWLSLAMLPLFLGGLVILGVVFGVRAGRPAWQGGLEVATFVVSGGAAGCSVLLLALASAPRQASVSMARVLAVLTGLAVLLVVSGEILALRTPHLSVQRYARALLDGPWSSFFWTELVLFFLAGIVCLATSWRKTISLAWAAITALLACAAVFLQRFLVLVAWQTHGLGLPWPAGTYHPTRVEWSVLAGVAAAAVLVFLLLAKVAGTETASCAGVHAPAGRRRLLATWASLVLGFAAAGVGLALSAGLASSPFLDPILPCSPLVFLAGLFLMLSAPLAYEMIPERGADTSPPHLPRE
jgi:molybdopterin-containing oxidoreductase family membrane subunit